MEPVAKSKRKPAEPAEPGLVWTNAGVYQKCIQDQQRILEVDKLRWGGREVGQMRPLSLAWVLDLKASVNCRPAAGLVECLVWDGAGMVLPSLPFGSEWCSCPLTDGSYYLLGGQHICRAVRDQRDEALAQGRVPEEWTTKVRATVIKFNTPPHMRRFLSGQHNAKSHAVRPVAMADALEAFHINEQDWRQGRMWKDTFPDPTLSMRVKAMLEETGLNTPNQPAV